MIFFFISKQKKMLLVVAFFWENNSWSQGFKSKCILVKNSKIRSSFLQAKTKCACSLSALSKKKNQIVNRSKVLLNDICYFSRLQPITFWIVISIWCGSHSLKRHRFYIWIPFYSGWRYAQRRRSYAISAAKQKGNWDIPEDE